METKELLDSSMDKLHEYYILRCNEELGDLYAIGTILCNGLGPKGTSNHE